MQVRVFAFVLAALAAISGCFAQDNAPPIPDVQRISYAQYGFDFALPQGYVKTPLPQKATDGWVEAYTCGGLAAGVGTGKMGPKQHFTADMEELARKEGLAGTRLRTPQGVEFAGASGTIKATKEMIQGLPSSLPLRPGMNIKLSVYMTALPSNRGRILAFFFVGPAERSSEVDDLAQSVLNSINFTGLKPGQIVPPPQATNQGPALTSGQIALYGKVKSIKAETKCLTMLADTVIAYGQKPVTLKPPRQKIVMFSELPKDVAVGCRILVIGPNAGTGKPMNAEVIRLEAATPPSR